MATTAELVEATCEQLIGEIRASRYRSVRALAADMDVDYVTPNRHLNGKSPLKLARVYDILERLELPLLDFFYRVQLRSEGLDLPRPH